MEIKGAFKDKYQSAEINVYIPGTTRLRKKIVNYF